MGDTENNDTHHGRQVVCDNRTSQAQTEPLNKRLTMRPKHSIKFNMGERLPK